MGASLNNAIRFACISLLLVLIACSDQQEVEMHVPSSSESISLIDKSAPLPIEFEFVSDVFLLGSDYTDLQRTNLEKEIAGKLVQWELPIYEISLLEDGTYLIITQPNFNGKSHLTATVSILAKSDKDRDYLATLKTNDLVSFKGVVTSINFRMAISVAPAVLVNK